MIEIDVFKIKKDFSFKMGKPKNQFTRTQKNVNLKLKLNKKYLKTSKTREWKNRKI